MTLKDLRHQAALSQEELARKINVSTLTISSWETGRRHPRAIYVRLLAIELGATLPEMIAALDETKQVQEVTTTVIIEESL